MQNYESDIAWLLLQGKIGLFKGRVFTDAEQQAFSECVSKHWCEGFNELTARKFAIGELCG